MARVGGVLLVLGMDIQAKGGCKGVEAGARQGSQVLWRSELCWKMQAKRRLQGTITSCPASPAAHSWRLACRQASSHTPAAKTRAGEAVGSEERSGSPEARACGRHALQLAGVSKTTPRHQCGWSYTCMVRLLVHCYCQRQTPAQARRQQQLQEAAHSLAAPCAIAAICCCSSVSTGRCASSCCSGCARAPGAGPKMPVPRPPGGVAGAPAGEGAEPPCMEPWGAGANTTVQPPMVPGALRSRKGAGG